MRWDGMGWDGMGWWFLVPDFRGSWVVEEGRKVYPPTWKKSSSMELAAAAAS